MEEARQAFEKVMQIKNKTNLEFDGKRYVNVNIQMYWRWFLTGWTMREGMGK